MTQDEIIEMARQAGDDWDSTLKVDKDLLVRFAKLVAAKERERIYVEQLGANTVEAIRSRGEA